MEKQLYFPFTKPQETVVEATNKYFVSQGFRSTYSSENLLIFERGSLLLNMVTMNPLKRKSHITIEIKDKEVTAVFDINTTSQLVTSKEERLWDSFIAHYRDAVLEDFKYAEVNNKLLKDTRRSTLKFAGAAIVGAIAAGVPAAIIAHYTGIGSIGGIGATAGALGYLGYMVEKERKRDAA